MNQRQPRRGLIARVATIGLVALVAAPALAQQSAPPGPPPSNDGQRRDDRGQGRDGGDRGGRMDRMRGRGPGLMRRFADSFRPDYMRRDLPMIREELKLDDAQAVLVQTLLSDYEEAFSPASEAAQAELEELGQSLAQSFFSEGMRDRMRSNMETFRADMEQLAAESGGQVDPEVRSRLMRERMAKFQEEMRKERESSGADKQIQETVGKMIDRVERWKSQRTQLRDELVNGLRSTLTEGQTGGWEKFDRFMRRERSIPQGVLSGESVNLFEVVDDAELAPEAMAPLASILDRYEMELDAALRARDSFLDQSEIKFLRAAQTSNQREADETARRASELHKAVRDLNDRIRDEIVAALPEEKRASVKAAALRAGYERVYRPTQTDRAFEVALELEDLSPESKPLIETLRAQYEAEAASINERIMQQVQKQDPQDVIDDAGRLTSMLNGMPPPGGFGGGRFGGPFGEQSGPLQEMFTKRGDLGDTYMRRLRDLLTPDQQAKLPQRQRGGRGQAAFGGPDGGGGGMLGGGRIADMPQQFQERVRQYDSNKDGVIDETERQAAMEGLRREFGGGRARGQAEGGGPGGPPAGGPGGGAAGSAGGAGRGGAPRE